MKKNSGVLGLKLSDHTGFLKHKKKYKLPDKIKIKVTSDKVGSKILKVRGDALPLPKNLHVASETAKADVNGAGLINYGEYKLTIGDFLRQGAVGLILDALISYTFYKSLFIFLMLLPVGCILFPLSRREHLKKQRLWRLTMEFREAIWIVSGYLGAGYSAENAFIKALPELRDMYGDDAWIVKEFKVLSKGVRLNKPLEEMLGDFASRSATEDIRNFAEVFAIAKRSGGNMKEIIENTTNIIRDKTSVSEEIKNMTAAKRYEQSIMNLLPFGLIIFIDVTTDGFLDVMYEGILGRCVMTCCLGMIILSYMLSKKILDIKI